MILPKAERRTSKDVAQRVGYCEVVTNSWMKRYKEHGMDGLRIRAIQGRLPSLNKETNLAAVREAVQQNHQRVSRA